MIYKGIIFKADPFSYNLEFDDRITLVDFDNHDKDAEEKDFANSDDTWVEEVESMF